MCSRVVWVLHLVITPSAPGRRISLHMFSAANKHLTIISKPPSPARTFRFNYESVSTRPRVSEFLSRRLNQTDSPAAVAAAAAGAFA